ncbi:MAG: hypothetical protein ACREHG_00730, partial [Candidatus Saccharimonadales bacterium]
NMYNGQSLNRYSYVLNNPLSLWDPWGLKEDPTISPPIQVVCPDGGPGSGCLCPIGMRPVPTGHAPGAYDCASSGPGGISPVGGGGGGPGGANGAGGFGRPGNNNNNSNQNKKNGCGSSKGIPAGEGLTPATPPVQILKPGSNQTQVTATNASQLQVALTNLSPALSVTTISFQTYSIPSIALGSSGADIAPGTTSVFRSSSYATFGPGSGSLTLTVTIDVKNDTTVAASFCGIGTG